MIVLPTRRCETADRISNEEVCMNQSNQVKTRLLRFFVKLNSVSFRVLYFIIFLRCEKYLPLLRQTRMLQHGGAFVIYLIASNIQSKVRSTMIKLILQLSDENILIGIMPLEGFLIYRSFYLKHD